MKKRRIICGVICFVLIFTILLPMFLTGCGSATLCSGVTILENTSSRKFEYNGYVVDNTALDWFLSSDYVYDVDDVIDGDFEVSFNYLDTTYIVFSSDENDTAIILYEGDTKNEIYIQLADNLVYDIYSKDGSPSIDYTDAGLYLYSETEITKVL